MYLFYIFYPAICVFELCNMTILVLLKVQMQMQHWYCHVIVHLIIHCVSIILSLGYETETYAAIYKCQQRMRRNQLRLALQTLTFQGDTCYYCPTAAAVYVRGIAVCRNVISFAPSGCYSREEETLIGFTVYYSNSFKVLYDACL